MQKPPDGFRAIRPEVLKDKMPEAGGKNDRGYLWSSNRIRGRRQKFLQIL